MSTATPRVPSIFAMATAFEDQSAADELVIPSDLTELSGDEINALFTAAREQFDGLMAGAERTPEVFTALDDLATGLESIDAELSRRADVAAEAEAQAQALAARVAALSADTEESEDEGDAPAEDEGTEDENPTEDEGAATTITASGAPAAPAPIRVPLRSVARAPRSSAPAPEAPRMESAVFATGEGLGVAIGEGMNWDSIGSAIDSKLRGYNSARFATAAASGHAVKEQHNIFAIKRDFAPELTIDGNDRAKVEEVFSHAADEKRLKGGGLVASGGWGAPSEIAYDLLEMETADGLLTLPEVNLKRGGLQFTKGPDYAEIFEKITGFHFTEEEDKGGKYQPGGSGNVVGPKPCYKIENPDFEEVRLDVDGLCIQAGILQSRGYPELIARTVRGALVAHKHRMNANLINALVKGSTAVEMADRAGTAAPLLDGIELQAQHYRYTHRLAENASLEAVFPIWVRGAVRADLSRRLGVDLLDVPDSRIDGWFRDRKLAPQFVYNWQALDTASAAEFVQWPTSVSFLLYSAGTWLRGASDLVTMDTLYDSTLLANNDFTALFTEEGWAAIKRGHDSRVVTVGISNNGATHSGLLIASDGTVATPTAVIPGE